MPWPEKMFFICAAGIPLAAALADNSATVVGVKSSTCLSASTLSVAAKSSLSYTLFRRPISTPCRFCCAVGLGAIRGAPIAASCSAANATASASSINAGGTTFGSGSGKTIGVAVTSDSGASNSGVGSRVVSFF